MGLAAANRRCRVFHSSVAMGRPPFLNILLLILSLKILSIKEPQEVLNWELGGQRAHFLALTEFNCVTLGKSLNLSVLQPPYLVKWE